MNSSHDFAPIRKLFWDYCAEDPDQIALVELGARKWSRRALGTLSFAIRRYLSKMGVNEGSAVAIMGPNTGEYVAAYFGIVLLGAAAVPINFHLTSSEVTHVLKTSKACCIVAHPSMRSKIREVLGASGAPNLPVVILNDELAADIGEEDQASDLLPRTLGRTMLFTSGTTGRPRGIVHSSKNSYFSIAQQISFREGRGTARDSDAVHLCTLPLHYAGPLEGVIVTLHMGNTVVLARRWDADEALRAIATHRVTECFVVPSMMVQLAKLPSETRSQHNISSLRLMVHAGAPCPATAKRLLLDWFGPIICEGYGASEGGGTFVTAEEWLRFPGTVGRPIPGARISIRSASGELLPNGQVGLIYIRPYTGDRFEYIDDPDATRSCYIGDEFTVRDLGHLNSAGYLFIADREDNVIICGGMNIYPAEIESVLLAHPLILDCAVIGRHDAELGRSPHALVKTSAPVIDLKAFRADIVKFAARHLAPYKIPRSIVVTENIPRSANGKVVKRLLTKGRD